MQSFNMAQNKREQQKIESESRLPSARMPTAVATGSNSGIDHALLQILIREVITTIYTATLPLIPKRSQGYEVHALDMTVGAKHERA